MAKDIERGLAEAIHSQAHKASSNWNAEKAQLAMAELCARKSIWPRDGEESRLGSADMFRSALAGHKDAREIVRELDGAGKPRQNKQSFPEVDGMAKNKNRI